MSTNKISIEIGAIMLRWLPKARLAWLIVFLTFGIGCESKKTAYQPPTLPPADNILSSPAKAKAGMDSSTAGTGITDEEAKKFADDWVDAIIYGDAEAADQLVDWNGIVDRALESFALDADVARELKKGANLNSLARTMTNALSATIKRQGGYQLVRILPRGKHLHAVIRLFDPGSGLNYHELRLVRVDGRIRADRFFVAVTGEEMADRIRKAIGPTLLNQSSILAKLPEQAKEDLGAVKTISEMMNIARDRQTAEVLRMFASLPDRYKNSKFAMLAVILATDPIEETTYLQTVDRYVNKFPNDPSLGLVAFQAAVIRKDPELLELSHRQIQNWSGGDPFLDLMVGGALTKMGKIDEAFKLTESIDPLPLKLSIAHDMKLTIALAVTDFKTVLENMIILKEEFQYKFTDLRNSDDFAEFVQSPEFAEWEAIHK